MYFRGSRCCKRHREMDGFSVMCELCSQIQNEHMCYWHRDGGHSSSLKGFVIVWLSNETWGAHGGLWAWWTPSARPGWRTDWKGCSLLAIATHLNPASLLAPTLGNGGGRHWAPEGDRYLDINQRPVKASWMMIASSGSRSAELN